MSKIDLKKQSDKGALQKIFEAVLGGIALIAIITLTCYLLGVSFWLGLAAFFVLAIVVGGIQNLLKRPLGKK